MPVITCMMSKTVAALPNTYIQLALLDGVGCAAASDKGLISPSRCSTQWYVFNPAVLLRCFRSAMVMTSLQLKAIRFESAVSLCRKSA